MVLGGALQAALLVLLLDPRRSPAVPASTTRATGIEDVSLGWSVADNWTEFSTKVQVIFLWPFALRRFVCDFGNSLMDISRFSNIVIVKAHALSLLLKRVFNRSSTKFSPCQHFLHVEAESLGLIEACLFKSPPQEWPGTPHWIYALLSCVRLPLFCFFWDTSSASRLRANNLLRSAIYFLCF